jgi:hypothetical protein
VINSRSSQHHSSGDSLDLNKASTGARESTPTPLSGKPLLNTTPERKILAEIISKHEVKNLKPSVTRQLDVNHRK